MMNRIPLVLLAAAAGPFLGSAPADIHDLNRELGRGINYGNVFEAPSEQEWGNPWDPGFPRMIADLGFDHVRMPVRWETRSLAEPPYTIAPEFFERIKAAVDQSLEAGLHVIINMHHHADLYADPRGQKERFLAQWDQIATFFKDYPERLLFEIFNEPHGNFTAELWNEFFPAALKVIRRTNPERGVLIGTANWGGLGGLPHLVWPEGDDRLILTVHYYNPFRFTHQGATWSGPQTMEWIGTTWDNTRQEREAVRRELAPLVEFSKKHNVPVHIGEFGAYSTADMDSRARWTTYVTRVFEELGFSWAYWEFSAGFGIYDRSAGELRRPLVDALLHNPMPPPSDE
ncbi:MAG: glycoside hydrolase family 5 protein [Puniceicoccaceae bacterium]|nr:MAG: glycoside hydrolase family 5 protein [Puniceicoccaceae bacterium]